MAAATGTASNGLNYIGNADYRGYLNYLGSNGDNTAKSLLAVAGNDGKLGEGGGSPLNSSAINANSQYYYNWVTGGGSGSGGSGSGGSNTDAADLAFLDDSDNQLHGQLSSSDTALNQGIQQLDDSFNQQNSRTKQDQSTADQGFNDQRTSTTKDKLTAVDNVNTGARSLSDSVRRILGLAAGANSSAYQLTAPQAIATDTTQKRTGVNDTYTKNYKSIDDANSATDLKFERALQDLADQRKTKEEGLRSGILQQQQSILSQIAQNALQRSEIKGGNYASSRAALAPISADIAARQAAIDNLFNQFRTPYTLQDTTPVAANTATYDVTPTTIDTSDNAGNTADGSTLSPYLAALQKKFTSDATTAPAGATA